MQWNSSTSAGFSSNPKTWLPVAPDYKQVNVEAESRDPNSMLNWYKKLIGLRRSNPAIRDGAMNMLDAGNDQIVAWSRKAPNGKMAVVACSFTAQPQTFSLKNAIGGSAKTAKTLAASGTKAQKGTIDLNAISLGPYGSIVAELE